MCHPLTTKPTLMQLKIQFITLCLLTVMQYYYLHWLCVCVCVFKGVHCSWSLQGRMLNLRWLDLILDSHGSIFWATKLLGITYVKYQIIGLQTSNQLYLRCRSRCHDTLLQDIGCFSGFLTYHTGSLVSIPSRCRSIFYFFWKTSVTNTICTDMNTLQLTVMFWKLVHISGPHRFMKYWG